MWNKYPTITSESIRALRQVSLTVDVGQIGGRTFVRCARRMGLTATQLCAIATNIREATGDDGTQVLWSYDGEVDYLQVKTDSRAYEFLCNLKS